MPTTAEEVRARIAALRDRSDWTDPAAFALGIATWSASDGTKVLDTYYPVPNRGENHGFLALLCEVAGVDGDSGTTELTSAALTALEEELASVLAEGGSHDNAEVLPALRKVPSTPSAPGVRRGTVVTIISDLDEPPLDAHDVYLRLHLLSTRRVRPHQVNLDGVFGLLSNVVWTDAGPCDPDTFEVLRAGMLASGRPPTVLGVDKFPRMVDYVIPSGVRIADADRVRLGAHLAEGTTVMHEGYVNFNAGTLGPSMVEGRISAGVVVGANSDIGGGASIMGTLSGGGKEVVSIGEGCLLGANSGVGISLGDRCTVEAGLYVTAGSVVTLPDGSTCKGRDLSGRDDMLLIRNSVTGAIELRTRTGSWEGLNASLHSNA